MATLKIDNAKFILTMDPERRIISDGSILVDGQRITQVGKAAEMAGVTADRTIDASEMVVTPGFCNAHLHISYAHDIRGIFPDTLVGGEYIQTAYKLKSVMSEEEEYSTTLLAITELLKYGTTCFLDPGSTIHIDACMEAYGESGVRANLGRQIAVKPNPVSLPVTPVDEAITQMEDTIRTYNHHFDDRIRAWSIPYSVDLATPELLKAGKEMADRYGTGLSYHVNNTPASIESHKQEFGKWPLEYLEDLGVLGPNVLLPHLIGAEDPDIDAMARTDTKGVMIPTASIKGGSGTTVKGKLPEMLAKGVCLGLGTDAGNNSNLVETLRSMYLITVLYKDGRMDTTAMSAEKAVEMATIDGARALGLDNDIGSLEAGKKADIVLFDTKRPEWRSLFNPVINLVFSADGRSVHTVIVDGQVRVDAGVPVFVDEWDLIQKVQVMGQNIMDRTGISYPQKWPIV